MTERAYRVGRRELWQARLYGWQERVRRPNVWGLLLAGLAILAGCGWWYVDHSAFARRAVPTTAVIEQTFAPVRVEHESGPPSLIVHGTLRYVVDGRTTYTRVRLASCSTSACVAVARARQGQTVQIAYDPKKVTRVYVGRNTPSGLNPTLLVLAGFGVIFIAGGLYTLLFDLGVPVTKPRDAGRREGEDA